jgi:UDP-N-acetylglucosamine--N-acetylmuramyl-(pentapeptide) pyrophosphoryl-undecaprenol N-acetylglucosamine transferase
MKIVFVGGGTGGHFYPLIAVAEAIRGISAERRILEPQMFYIAPEPFDEEALFENNIAYIKSPAGKIRRYASVKNVTGFFSTFLGVLRSLIILFRIFPDVVFSKGGYASVPTVIAAHFLRIPVIIHESDAKFGRGNMVAARDAYKIAVAFPSIASSLPEKLQKKVIVTGIPIRSALATASFDGAKQLLGLEAGIPTIFIIGGSLGSQRINNIVLEILAELVAYANVIHQTGKDNFEEVHLASSTILRGNSHAARYHAFAYLGAEPMRQASTAADLIVSRAGSTAITEISLWKKPAILIPIPEEISHDQRTNAYAYAHTGGATVLEEANLTPHVLASEIWRILQDPLLATEMAEKGSTFAKRDAAHVIAEELIAIGLSHEPQK